MAEEVVDILAKDENGFYLNPEGVVEGIRDGSILEQDAKLSALPPTFWSNYGLDQADSQYGWKDIADTYSAQVEASQNRTAAEEDLVAGRDNARADVYNIGKGALDITRTAQALGQIKKGKQQREEAVRPSLPAQTVSEDLRSATQEAGARAQRGLSQQSLGATASRDLASYANALKSAQSYGGGQASVAGAMSNKAYRDILDRNLQSAQMNEQVNNANFGQYANLAQARASEQGQIRNSLNRDYEQRLGDHRRDLGEAALLERTGRINLGNIQQTLPYTAANLTRQYYRNDEQRGNRPLSGTPQGDAYEAQINADKLARRERTKGWINNQFGKVQNAFTKSQPLPPLPSTPYGTLNADPQLPPIGVVPTNVAQDNNQYMNLSNTPYYGIQY